MSTPLASPNPFSRANFRSGQKELQVSLFQGDRTQHNFLKLAHIIFGKLPKNNPCVSALVLLHFNTVDELTLEEVM